MSFSSGRCMPNICFFKFSFVCDKRVLEAVLAATKEELAVKNGELEVLKFRLVAAEGA